MAVALKPSIAACTVAASGHIIIVLAVFAPVEVALKLIAPAAYIFGHIAVPVACIAFISENSQSVKVANISLSIITLSLVNLVLQTSFLKSTPQCEVVWQDSVERSEQTLKRPYR